MKYRRLGKTDLRVSVVGLGTWQFGGEWGKAFSQAEADRIVEKAQELGINLIDTAECYGDHVSESLVGNAIRTSREAWIVATKFGHRFSGNLKERTCGQPAKCSHNWKIHFGLCKLITSTSTSFTQVMIKPSTMRIFGRC